MPVKYPCLLMLVNACQCLSMLVHACQCLLMLVNTCQCLSIYGNIDDITWYIWRSFWVICLSVLPYSRFNRFFIFISSAPFNKLKVNACRCLSMLVNTCQCLSMLANACQCLSIWNTKQYDIKFFMLKALAISMLVNACQCLLMLVNACQC